VLNEHNTVFARSGPLYATGVSLGLPESSMQTASRSLQPFLQSSLGDRSTDRPTDQATRSVTICEAHSGEAKFCYCLRLQGVSLDPPESSTQTTVRSLQPFLQDSLNDRPTDRPTDHATWSVTTGGAHNEEVKLCYCLQLQQVFIGVVDSTDRNNLSNQQETLSSRLYCSVSTYTATRLVLHLNLYSDVRLDGLQCTWRHCNIASKRVFPTGVPDR